MSITNTNAVAKVAAVVAGLGLVFASFAPVTRAQSTSDLQAQIAALLAQINSLQSQLGTSQTASMTFTADLTIGSTGADVTALQNWLIAKGYSIPAGATGYFGAQTQSALAAYQAANGISPAAGYFGPVTRAKVNASAGTSTGTGTGSTGGTSSSGLSGGEADLTNYDLRAGDDLDEGSSDTEIATAKFDVDGGDVNVQRVKVVLQANSTSYDNKPWQYLDNVSVYLDGKKIGDADANSKSDWDEDDRGGDFTYGSGTDYYTITVSTNGVVKDGDTAELSVRADAQSNFDSDVQTFQVTIPEDGIRATDAAGIQQYTGDDSDHVTFGLNSEQSGDLSIRQSDEDPDAAILVADDTDTSDEFTVFAFDLKNSDDADALLDQITVEATVGQDSGITGHTTDLRQIVRKATLTVDGDDYDGDVASTSIDFDDLDTTVDANDTATAVLTVELYGQENHYAATGQTLTFKVDDANNDVEAEGADSGDDADVSGAYTGATHSVLLTGIDVASNSTSQSVTSNNNNSVGNYTIKFDVTAVEDNAYIPATASKGASTTAGAIYSIIGDTFTGTSSAVLTSTADKNASGNYEVNEGSTETFTLTVALDPSSTGIFGVQLTDVQFGNSSTDTSPDSNFDVPTSNDDFQTDAQTVPGS
ncbi:MAG TPA: peptidoglycan-binding protein [Candidatus Paceibacterota bacterium]